MEGLHHFRDARRLRAKFKQHRIRTPASVVDIVYTSLRLHFLHLYVPYFALFVRL